MGLEMAPLAAMAAVLLFPAIMIYAGIADLLTYKIKNALILALAAGFLVLAPLAGLALADIAMHLAVALLVLAVTFGLFAAGWIGGGDAKLAAAAALWLGWDLALAYFVYAALLGGALTLALILFRRIPPHPAFYSADWLARLHGRESGVPYGVALSAAALILFPQTGWLAAIA